MDEQIKKSQPTIILYPPTQDEIDLRSRLSEEKAEAERARELAKEKEKEAKWLKHKLVGYKEEAAAAAAAAAAVKSHAASVQDQETQNMMSALTRSKELAVAEMRRTEAEAKKLRDELQQARAEKEEEAKELKKELAQTRLEMGAEVATLKRDMREMEARKSEELNDTVAGAQVLLVMKRF